MLSYIVLFLNRIDDLPYSTLLIDVTARPIAMVFFRFKLILLGITPCKYIFFEVYVLRTIKREMSSLFTYLRQLRPNGALVEIKSIAV